MKHENRDHCVRSFENHQPQIGTGVFIDKTAVVIGQVSIGENSSIWPLAVIRGDMHSISIGARTSIQDGSVLHITHAGPFNEAGWPLNIGDDCTIAHNVTLHGCTIGNKVLVGMGSIIMDGAQVPDETVIGANSLVPPGKILASGFLYTGAPARQVRPLSDAEKAYFSYSSNNYCKLKDRYLAERQ